MVNRGAGRRATRTKLTADVAIIGGGVTGAYCAYRITQMHPELEVRLFEREVAPRPAAHSTRTEWKAGGKCSHQNALLPDQSVRHS